MLGQDAVDARPSYFFTDQYDLSMEYSGDIPPSGYDQVIFRRHPDPRQLIVFWLHEQRVQAGMNINIWDVADDIERLVQSPHPANTEDLADPRNGRPGQRWSAGDAAIQRTGAGFRPWLPESWR
jgi:3-phenylpropionate/trans-cinnamate dioxygenase ferredoxin reductase component